MLALNTKQSRKIDEEAVNKYEIPLLILMENAGRAVADSIIKYRENNDRDIIFVLGVGNNGADGLVAARHLLSKKISFKIFYLGNIEKASKLFLKQKNILENMNVEMLSITDISEEVLKNILQGANIIVDGIMGTGLNGALRDDVRNITALINDSKVKILAIDVPSGLQIDNGLISEDAIKADYTVTMAGIKLGMNLYPGKNNCGKILTCDIGTPNIEDIVIDDRNVIVNEELIKSLLPKRSPVCHKGDNGHILIIGGSEGMYGAPLLSAGAAIYSGAGKTTLGLRQNVFEQIINKAPNEVMGVKLPFDFDDLSTKEIIQFITKDKDSIAIGPGMGRTVETKKIVEAIVFNYDGPLLLDADALYVLNQNLEIISNREIPTVITPHVGEFAHITGYSAKYIERNRVDVAREFAKKYQIILVLKGAPTVIALPNGTVFINTTGNPGMATGGMGDVLTGIIAAFLGQGLLIEEAAIIGVYLHGLSADILAKEKVLGYTASDVSRYIGNAITKIIN